MRRNSTCGIRDRRHSSHSSLSSGRVSGSPPESRTSRTDGCRLDVGDGLLPLLGVEAVLVVADHPGAGAVAAVGRAEAGHQEQDPVGVAVDQAGHRAVVVLAQRVVGLAAGEEELVAGRHHGPAERVARILGVEQAGVVRGDGHRQGAPTAGQGRPLLFGKLEDVLQVGSALEAVTQLPAPVVPLGVGGLGEEVPAEFLAPLADLDAARPGQAEGELSGGSAQRDTPRHDAGLAGGPGRNAFGGSYIGGRTRRFGVLGWIDSVRDKTWRFSILGGEDRHLLHRCRVSSRSGPDCPSALFPKKPRTQFEDVLSTSVSGFQLFFSIASRPLRRDREFGSAPRSRPRRRGDKTNLK